jgi:anti-sigma28 factor (negative regulator of flagellin synthesis)
MRVSDTEVKKVLGQHSIASEITRIGEDKIREKEGTLVGNLVKEVASMSDREERIAELRAQIEAGTYKPAAEDIVDTMVRRSIVDNFR